MVRTVYIININVLYSLYIINESNTVFAILID